MPNYRRADIAGASYFFTIVSHQRSPILCDDAVRAALRLAIIAVKNKHPFAINAWVLLPDHLHCIWTLPEHDNAFSVRWSMIKRLVTQRLAEVGNGAHGAPYEGSQLDCRVRHAHHEHPEQIHPDHREHYPHVSASRTRRREGCIWQRRFWEHRVRDQAELNRCLDYLHWNPVKHGYVSRAADWPFSTFHRFVRQGVYPEDWGGQGVVEQGAFGE